MRYAIIEDGVVINIAKADKPLGKNWVPAKKGQIDDKYANGKFTTPPPKQAPEKKSPTRKLGELLVSKSILTENEIENL